MAGPRASFIPRTRVAVVGAGLGWLWAAATRLLMVTRVAV